MNLKNTGPTEAIILAGGFGTRLRKVVTNVPKPMAPVLSRPFLEYLMDYWLECGVSHFVLSVGYLAECIIGHFGDAYRGARVSYVREIEPLGTGGALALAVKSIPWSGRQILMLNGDTWMPADPAHLVRAAKESPLTIALTEVPHNDRYGGVELDSAGYIRRFGLPADGCPALINTGCYLFDLLALRRLLIPLPERFSLESDFLPASAKRGLVRGDVQKTEFIDIGVPDDYTLFCERFGTKERK